MEYRKISTQILRDHQDDLMWEYQGSEGWSGGYNIQRAGPHRTHRAS